MDFAARDTSSSPMTSAAGSGACARTGGFAENFDAQTGEGLRDRAYTWIAAVYLILARDARRRRSR